MNGCLHAGKGGGIKGDERWHSLRVYHFFHRFDGHFLAPGRFWSCLLNQIVEERIYETISGDARRNSLRQCVLSLRRHKLSSDFSVSEHYRYNNKHCVSLCIDCHPWCEVHILQPPVFCIGWTERSRIKLTIVTSVNNFYSTGGCWTSGLVQPACQTQPPLLQKTVLGTNHVFSCLLNIICLWFHGSIR